MNFDAWSESTSQAHWSAHFRKTYHSECFRIFHGALRLEVDQLQIQRCQELRRREKQRGKRTISSEASTSPNDAGNKLVNSWNEHGLDRLASFHEFSFYVRELVGRQPSQHEVEEAIGMIWDILHDKVEGYIFNREVDIQEMQKMVSAVDEDTFNEAFRLGSSLGDHAEGAHAGPSEKCSTTQTPTNEFGLAVEFLAPSHRKTLNNVDVLQESGMSVEAKASAQLSESSRYTHPLSFDTERENNPTGLQWLSDQCQKIFDSDDGDSMALAICRVVFSEVDAQNMALQLFDLVGERGVGLIPSVVDHRDALRDDINHRAQRLREAGCLTKDAQLPPYGLQVVVKSGYEKELERLRRKEIRKAGKKTGADGSNPVDLIRAFGVKRCLRDSPDFCKPESTFLGSRNPFIQRGLPQGTVRCFHRGYEEVKVPAAPSRPFGDSEHLIPTSDLPEYAQAAFGEFEYLNRIQSQILQAGLYTNQNLLVCAPTGAGKTNIAMIAILREIGLHLNNKFVDTSAFKIVYIAPMKALAAEMVSSFSKRLLPLDICVREFTGDMQLSRKELTETHMIVTTPEKWDVITRKGGDVAVANLVTLLIIDEVHLLNDDRGPVIETLVARTLRQVEASQSLIRIVGLSATLPNYRDVAKFLHVNEKIGLFYFDASYRPIPLCTQFIGISEPNVLLRSAKMNEVCYEKVLSAIQRGKQVMIFVHARKETAKTARDMVEIARTRDEIEMFDPREHPLFSLYERHVSKSRNREIQELFLNGFSLHHAGMLRSDRNLTEKMFSSGITKVLVCTATLAWGVNLPAHTVIIKGTQLYDAQRGRFCDLGILDVQQIFGRAGRPQFDSTGEGIIITSHDKLNHYLSLLTNQLPIESQFISLLRDCLNAEIVLGTVSTVADGIKWLGYTYLYVRMRHNPLAYGISWTELQVDPSLESKRRCLILDAARSLHQCKMARFDEKSGNIYPTHLGRVASHFYLTSMTVETYNTCLKPDMTEADLFAMISMSSEFENVVIRSDEVHELEKLKKKYCPIEVLGGIDDRKWKVGILLQTYICRGSIDSSSLIADLMYVSQNAGRLFRATFEICTEQRWPNLAELVLMYAISVERRVWPFQHPLRQFENMLKPDILCRLEEEHLFCEELEDLCSAEIGTRLGFPNVGDKLKRIMKWLPAMELEGQIQPVSRSALRITLTMHPKFSWCDKAHGNCIRWIVWVEDTENEHIYHLEQWTAYKKWHQTSSKICLNISLTKQKKTKYIVRCLALDWLCLNAFFELSCGQLVLPYEEPTYTELLDLKPLPISAVQCAVFEKFFEGRFANFNRIQTQVFFPFYNLDVNVLLGAPIGSGKTVCCELAMLRQFRMHPNKKIVYVAPFQSLVHERFVGWRNGLCKALNKSLSKLTGEFDFDSQALQAADVVVSAPDEWNGISRGWDDKSYIKNIGLIIIDDIHLLGTSKGAVIEAIVSRANRIEAENKGRIRIIALSAELGDAADVGDWLRVPDIGMFNFKPSARPVPIELHYLGFAGKFYCPRMTSMNKPCYKAIQTYSPHGPVTIFVSSCRQARLTALDLIAFAMADGRNLAFTNEVAEEMEGHVSKVRDKHLKHSLYFGIGLYHAGLPETDRKAVEELYSRGKIQLLIAPMSLTWAINLPAQLIIIKGTEYYDASSRQYVDYPITDILQMIGKAGRPQFDMKGNVVLMVQESKRKSYMASLSEPLMVESSLMEQIQDHLNAEIVLGNISTYKDSIGFLDHTFLSRRLQKNPSYYGLSGAKPEDVGPSLEEFVTGKLKELHNAGCIAIDKQRHISPLSPGTIASSFYLSYKTASLFSRELCTGQTAKQLLHVLSGAEEFSRLTVHHNEEALNSELSNHLPIQVDELGMDDPHLKAHILLQAHLTRIKLPTRDYITETKFCLVQSQRMVQGMIKWAAEMAWLNTFLSCVDLQQMLLQGIWKHQSSIRALPNVDESFVAKMQRRGISNLRDLLRLRTEDPNGLKRALHLALVGRPLANEVEYMLSQLPIVDATCRTIRTEQHEGKMLSTKDTNAGIIIVVDVRISNRQGKNSTPRANLPRYPASKVEGWWVVAGLRDTNELFSCEYVSSASRQEVVLHVCSHHVSSLSAESELDVFVRSDCYVGLDLELKASIPPSIETEPGSCSHDRDPL